MIRELPSIRLDLDGWKANFRRQGTPSRVFFFEHGVADEIQDALDARFALTARLDRSSQSFPYEKAVAIYRFLGMEFFRVFPPGARMAATSVTGAWADEHTGRISTWRDFDNFPWLDPRAADLSVYEYYEKRLPPDMRVFQVNDFWEYVRDLFGFESFCYKLYEEPDLIEAVFRKVGEFNVAIAEAVCDFNCFGALYISDDLGYKTSTMIAPETIRRFIIPWHKKMADVAHRHGKFVWLHSCGDMYALIDDYIDYVGVDAKHSFEDVILPVTDAKKRYGERLTLLGGMDVDLLARRDEKTIRAKTREILDVCVPGGGYFLGSGNWVTNYIPLDNYLIMLDEARRYVPSR
ncbi:MAG: uroporphyrinogen decarboxylase family protein [Planctomycetota bacterium]